MILNLLKIPLIADNNIGNIQWGFCGIYLLLRP